MLAASPAPRTLVSQAAVGYYGDRGEAIIDESTPRPMACLSQIVVDWENEALEADGRPASGSRSSAPGSSSTPRAGC